MKRAEENQPNVLKTGRQKWRGNEARPLTTDERASFLIVSLYLFLFCLAAFMYWDSLLLKIAGVTAASGGVFLFVAAFFDTEAPVRNQTRHPLRSYLISFFIVLLVLFCIRLIAGWIRHPVAAMVVAGVALVVALIVFRKAMVQVTTTLLAVLFLFVTISNRHDVLTGRMSFRDAVRQCAHLVFQIGPIRDIVNLMVAGNYMGYLSRIDYHDEQINILATRLVADTQDDEVRKTRAILDFVSNEIYYVSDPGDGEEYAKDPISTLIAGGGDCEDQTLLLCSLLETVGIKTYIAFTDDHVFALVRFSGRNQLGDATPLLYVEGDPCYALDPADPGAVIGRTSARADDVRRVFDVRGKAPAVFSARADR